MKNKNLIFGIILISVLAAGGICFLSLKKPGQQKPPQPLPKTVNSFEECEAAGYPIAESYPQKCTRLDGKSFTQDIGNELEKTDLIRVENPRPNQTITSPIVIKGEARGTWFFEASFPIKLKDEKGNVIATTIAHAQDDWMTENFVSFSAILEFQTTTQKGNLILEKDNPSGLPQNADELRIPVKIIPPPSPSK